MSDLIDRHAVIDAMAELQGRASTKAELKGISKIWKRIKHLPSAQPDEDMIHLQKEQAYMQGWEEGRKALREELWGDARKSLDR